MPGAEIIVLFLYVQVLVATILLMEAGILLVAGFGTFGGPKIDWKDWRALTLWISFGLLAVAVGCDWLVLRVGRKGSVFLSDEYCSVLMFTSVLGLALTVPGQKTSVKAVLLILAVGLIAVGPILHAFSALLMER